MNAIVQYLLLIACALAIFYGMFLLSAPISRFRSISKTLPMLILVVAAFAGGLHLWVLLALLACSAGDWFSSLENEDNFIYGLSAFLIGHLFYILYFFIHSDFALLLTQDMQILGAILIALAASVLLRIWPYLSDLKIPVIIYTAAIIIMAFSARLANSAQLVLTGVALFLISDIILAQDKFTPLSKSWFRKIMPWMVWVCYFSGQALIVYGLITIR